MKRTQLTDIWRLITHAKGFFAVMALIIAFGTAAFAGISFSTVSLFDDCKDYFDTHELYDVELGNVYGFDDVAIQEIANTEGVEKVGAEYLTHALIKVKQDTYVAEFYTQPGELNKAELVDGRLPQASNECVVEKAFIDRFGYKIGDAVTLSGESSMLSHTQYTIVGVAELVTVFVRDDFYNRGSTTLGDGQITTKIMLADSGFTADASKQICFVTMTDAPDRDSDEYWERVEALKKKLLTLAEKCDERRFAEITGEYDSQISDAQDSYDSGMSQLYAALAYLNDVEGQVSAGWSTYNEQFAQYQQMQASLAQARTSLDSQQAELESSRTQLNEAKTQLEAAKQELDESLTELQEAEDELDTLESALQMAKSYLDQYEPGTEEYEVALAYYNQALSSYNEASESYQTSLAQYNTAKSEYDASYAEYQANEEAYSEAASNLSVAWNQYYATAASVAEYGAELERAGYDLTAAQNEINSQRSVAMQSQSALYDMNEEIIKAQQERAGLPNSRAFVSDLNSNPSYYSYTTMADGTTAVVTVLCTLLMAIAILICYTTISRMVTEDHRIIGTQKALGVRRREIYAKYLIYVAIATFTGVVLGVVASYLFVEDFAYITSYENTFIFRDFKPIIIWPQVLILAAIDLLVMMTAAFLACKSLVKKRTVELLNDNIRNEDPSKLAGKGGLRSRLSLDMSIILRSLKSNPQVLTTTLVSVAGTVILLIAVLTVKSSLGGIAERQFYELQNYSGTITINTQSAQEDQDALKHMLETSNTVSVMPVLEMYLSYNYEGSIRHASVLALDSSSNVADFLTIRDVDSGEILGVPQEGVLICQKIAENGNYKIGDTFILTDEYGDEYKTTICGVFERNIGFELICSKDYFNKVTNSNDAFFQYYISGTDENVSAKLNEVRSYPAYLNYMDARYYESEMEYKVQCVDSIIMFILAASILLALFVLLNMAAMNIKKKSRDIVVMKVLGVPARRIKSYIFWEAMIMCGIGLVVGVIIGAPLGDFIARSIEMDNLVGIRGISASACVIGAATNAVIFTVINALSLRGVSRVKMTGSAREA